MTTYIARDVQRLTHKETVVEIDGAHVATFVGAYGTRLFADFIHGAAQRGDTVKTDDGTFLVGTLDQLDR